MKDKILQRLERLDTCVLSDSLDKFGKTGAINGLASFTSGLKISGKVITVSLGNYSTSSMSKSHLGSRAIDLAGDNNVIVISHKGPSIAAGWGGILSKAALLKKVRGVIIDGPVRDIHESSKLGFPVFCKGNTPISARHRVVELSTNKPIVIQGVSIYPNDYVLADENGVVVIRFDDIHEVVAVAESLKAKEEQFITAIKAGKSIVSTLDEKYENLLK